MSIAMAPFYRRTWAEQGNMVAPAGGTTCRRTCLLPVPSALIRADRSLVSLNDPYLVFRQDLFLEYRGARWYRDMQPD